ncbi:uncharacterized protein RCC_01540 [Ramularia collo-cygni]|uniref:F-box domain-containing protein n=1 Tax=Ramularia collo-cygni TaxID=112498 RepID=A0A2D3UX56_9PEZI|nr:uncharacterized protein RCC_01540 [Ramularia collo-cygni]CZT15706.1 uncharacterized protein RCC_01540 [Ramularia collo-cygni]
MTSATRALAVPELLEMILLHLPVRSLIRAQRVSSEWHNGITFSKTLRARVAFLSPCPESGTLSSGESITTFNPTIIPPPDRASLNTAVKLARKNNIPTSAFPLGIPFTISSLLSRPKGPWMDRLISQPPPRESITITTLWTSDIRFSEGGENSTSRFQTLGPSATCQITLTGNLLTWGEVGRSLRERIAEVQEQNRALSMVRGRFTRWEPARVAWVRLDGAVRDTEERVVREMGADLA